MYSGALAGRSGLGAQVGRRNPRQSAFVAGSTRNRPAEAENSDVRGLSFLFRSDGYRLVLDSNGRVLWRCGGEDILASTSACIAIIDGRIAGRTRHSERLFKNLLTDCLSSREPVQTLLASAANEIPELLVTAQRSSESSELIALTVRALQRALHGIPDLMRLYSLTPTENQIVGMMLQGLSVTAIAEELRNSVLTVRTHIKRAYLKLNVSSKEQLFSTMMKLMVG